MASVILDVVFMDSGQGDSTLVRFSDQRLMWVDCGMSKDRKETIPAIAATLKDYLALSGNKITWLVLTHPHIDHYNGFLNVLNSLPSMPTIEKVYYGGDLEDYQGQLKTWLQTLSPSVLWSPQIWLTPNVLTPSPPADVKVYMWANVSGPVSSHDPNTNSIVLLLCVQAAGEQFRVFLMGDATSWTEQMIYAKAPDKSILKGGFATALKLGHHGSTGASSDSWVTTVNPTALLISSATKYFSGTGLPALSHLTHVVSLSPNLAQTGVPSHSYVAFDDSNSPTKGMFLASSPTTAAICSTLYSVNYTDPVAAYPRRFDAAGGQWTWRLYDDGSLSLAKNF